MTNPNPPIRQVNEPELLLPDEKLPPGTIILARSSFIGGEYSSLASLIAKRKKAERALNEGLADWQTTIQPPAYVVFSTRNDATGERLFVFGHIPDIETLSRTNARAAEIVDLAKMRLLRQRLENALKRGWLYGQWFSRTQPEGEWGVMHKKFLQSPMSETEFESFRAKGWITGEEGI